MLFTLHNMSYNMPYKTFSFFSLGAQGPADRYSSPEHSGGALQLAAFS